jgi:hypothetical protein
MSYIPIVDCSCNGGIIFGIAQCKACNDSYDRPSIAIATQKKIWNTVRVPASEYTMNVASLNVYQYPGKGKVNWNQMSDRVVPGEVKNSIPRYSGATQSGTVLSSSRTRERPGSTRAAGKGVDIKHGSYARYLARLKGKGPLRTQRDTSLTNSSQSVAVKGGVVGNKTKSYGIVNSRSCLCFT